MLFPRQPLLRCPTFALPCARRNDRYFLTFVVSVIIILVPTPHPSQLAHLLVVTPHQVQHVQDKAR